MIHIYCGDGKGKTTAAIGLAVRAAGRGISVVVARFLKNDDSGEVISLRHVPGIEVIPCERSFGFTWNMTEEDKKEAALYYQSLFERTFAHALEVLEKSGSVLLVLDELMAAIKNGFVQEEMVLEALKRAPSGLEVVMTGRDPGQALVDLADYVSDISPKKHPYEYGIAARCGIEY